MRFALYRQQAFKRGIACMIQKKYTFHLYNELEKITDELVASEAYKNASGVLLQLYNPKLNGEDERIVEHIRAKCSKACLAGISCANIADEEFTNYKAKMKKSQQWAKEAGMVPDDITKAIKAVRQEKRQQE